MSGTLVPVGRDQYVVVVKGFGFVTNSGPIRKPEAVKMLTRLTFTGKEKRPCA